MNFVLLNPAPALGGSLDRGTLVVVAALFLVSILAHRLWRGRIRAEDELEALRKDMALSQGRYRAGFRALGLPAAFADRATGLVIEVTPGWAAAGLPPAGRPVWGEDPSAEAAWRAIPAPAPDGQAAESRPLSLAGRSVLATPLSGDSLGVVLLERA